MALSQEQIAALKSEHGQSLVSFSTPEGKDLVFKKPGRAVWADFVASVSNERTPRETAIRRLALACAVSPKADEVDAIFAEYPALPARVTDELSKLAGASEEFEAKKL